MKAALCVKTLADLCMRFPRPKNAILHPGRGSQYTSKEYRDAIGQHGTRQSMNSDDGCCHDHACCEGSGRK